MPEQRSQTTGPAAGCNRGTVCAGAFLLLLVGCSERERLTFPDAGDPQGPVTTIDRPGVAETTVTAGPNFVVNGRTADPDGVDTVRFLLTGGGDQFPPLVGGGDSVRFGLPVSTADHQGDTLDVEVYGVDSQGNRGASAFRRLLVK
jgi:hypothetical protein